MKIKTIFLSALLLAGFVSAVAQSANDWENPQVNSSGRLKAHAYSLPLASVDAALTDALVPSTP